MIVAELVHADGDNPCHQVSQTARDSWIEIAEETNQSWACLGCNAIVTMADMAMGDGREEERKFSPVEILDETDDE